jgi:hypothetical protein
MIGWAEQLFGAVLAGTAWYPPLWDGEGADPDDPETRSLFNWLWRLVTDCDWGEGVEAACAANEERVGPQERGKTRRRIRRKTRGLFTGSLFPTGF